MGPTAQQRCVRPCGRAVTMGDARGAVAAAQECRRRSTGPGPRQALARWCLGVSNPGMSPGNRPGCGLPRSAPPPCARVWAKGRDSLPAGVRAAAGRRLRGDIRLRCAVAQVYELRRVARDDDHVEVVELGLGDGRGRSRSERGDDLGDSVAVACDEDDVAELPARICSARTDGDGPTCGDSPSWCASGSTVCWVRVNSEVRIAVIPAGPTSRASAWARRWPAGFSGGSLSAGGRLMSACRTASTVGMSVRSSRSWRGVGGLFLHHGAVRSSCRLVGPGRRMGGDQLVNAAFGAAKERCEVGLESSA